MTAENDARQKLVRNYPGAANVSHENRERLSEWMAEPVRFENAHFMIRRSSLQILERLETDGLRGRIGLIQAIQAIEENRSDNQRLLEEAQKKLSEIRSIVARDVERSSDTESGVEKSGTAWEILSVLERPAEPLDSDNGPDGENI